MSAPASSVMGINQLRLCWKYRSIMPVDASASRSGRLGMTLGQFLETWLELGMDLLRLLLRTILDIPVWHAFIGVAVVVVAAWLCSKVEL